MHFVKNAFYHANFQLNGTDGKFTIPPRIEAGSMHAGMAFAIGAESAVLKKCPLQASEIYPNTTELHQEAVGQYVE